MFAAAYHRYISFHHLKVLMDYCVERPGRVNVLEMNGEREGAR
jgi:hypothetical protein